MKFFIYLSLVILILAPFASIECRSHSKNSKNKKNKHPGMIHRVPKLTSQRPVTNIQRPYSNQVSISRPVSAVVPSSPTGFSGTPQGPHFGVVRGGFVARPLRLVRRFAVLRPRLNECPLEFLSNGLVIQRDNYCPEVCSRTYCVQISDICCIYRDGLVDEI